VRCLSFLYHPNIIRYNTSWIEKQEEVDKEDIYDIDISNYIQLNIFIQMELMDISLKEYLVNTNKNSIDKHFIIKNILNGVKYLHLNDIIHCDLKPDNILLNIKDKNIINIKIADFGLVFEKHNHKSNNYGCPIYMAPDKKFTEKYDIYSLGVIFFEILNCFNTNMEKYLEVKKLKDNEYLDKYPLFTKMVSINPLERPTLNEIENKYTKKKNSYLTKKN
tara:strand:- start:7 stop:666 length:660 start_codon:yes stop_codon:yes gene_type:complete